MIKIYTYIVSSLICLTVLLPISVFAQANATIKGEIYTIDGKPLSYASIRLKGTKYNCSVTEDGTFSMQVPQGDYRLEVTYANYAVYQKPIKLKAGQGLILERIIVQSNSTQLREVIVSDIQRNKFAKKETDDVARMPLSNLRNPQAYSVISKDLMMELAATDYNSALSQVPGAVVSTGVNDNGNGVYLRGFSNSGNGNSNMVRNGLPINSRAVSEIFNLDKVEILKGPSATLFGAQVTSYGGIINNVTKRPFESFRGEISYLTGSFGMNRLTADINAPLNKDRTALGRFNILGMNHDGFQNEGKNTAIAFATSLQFKAGEKTTVRFDADVYNTTKPLVAFIRNTNKLTVSNMKDFKAPFDRSYTSNDVATNRTNINIGAEIEHQISDSWTSRTSYLYNNSGDKGSIFMVPMIVDDQRIERRYRIFDDFNLNYSVIQQNFNGSYQIGAVKNQVLIGADATLFTSKNLYLVPYFAILDTVNVNDPIWKPLTRTEVNNSREKRSFGDGIDNSKYHVISGYISNVTNISDRLFLMLSARLNKFYQGTITSYSPGQPEVRDEQGKVEQRAVAASYTEKKGYNQANISPKIGIVYQPIKDQVSIFANYMNSFTNNAASMGLSNPSDLQSTPVLTNWKPEQAYQFEAGAKFELMNGLINSNISYYTITVHDKVRQIADAVNAQDGKFNSKGFEIDLIANPLKGWNVILGYGFNENEYIMAADGLVGLREAWTPKHVANVWTSYKFLTNKLKGFGAGVGMNYVDQVLMNMQDDFIVPSATIFNATLFYDQPKYRVGIKLNNFTNKKYWDVFARPQKPFEFLANLSFKF
ncbi:TonB-dependent receptor domain-containing protein [Sphingobacterium sp. HJSM2_6]|uniref:TonB-dependent receptor domain-containing protein n=1 Tax=Sphingobacterium sp. HJSM2_6 TaxID=3366264 RepID=UPI003BE6D45F